MVYFIIIYGTRGMTSTGSVGDFHCPSCGKCSYRHQKVRRWFTLFFIPIIPLDVAGEYIECNQCFNTYELHVLSYDPVAEQREFEAVFHTAIRRTMIKMCLADGVVDQAEIEVIRDIYSKLTDVEISEDDLREEIAEAMTDKQSVQQYLRAGPRHVQPQGEGADPQVGVLRRGGRRRVRRGGAEAPQQYRGRAPDDEDGISIRDEQLDG